MYLKFKLLLPVLTYILKYFVIVPNCLYKISIFYVNMHIFDFTLSVLFVNVLYIYNTIRLN